MASNHNRSVLHKLFSVQKNRLVRQSAIKGRLLRIEALEERSLLTATVGIAATDAVAAEAPTSSANYGSFTATRTGTTNMTQPLTVYFQTSGTATSPSNSNSDYQLYDSNGYQLYQTSFYDQATNSYIYCYSATIAANASSTTIELRPVNDALRESTETAVLTLLPNAAYDVDSTANSATVSIQDNDNWTVSIAATDATAAEAPTSSSNYGAFTATRSGETDLSQPLTVYFQTSGTATSPSNSNSDYQLYDSNGYQLYQTNLYDPATSSYIYCYMATIPANAASTTIQLRPVNDALRESTETAVLTLLPNAAYDVNSTANSATVSIQDNDNWTVSVVATDANALENSTDYGVWTFSRVGETDLSNALALVLTRSGTASYNSDYALYDSSGNQLYENYYYDPNSGSYQYGFSVTIPSGSVSTMVELRTIDDSQAEPMETATLTFCPSDVYVIDSSHSSGTVNILDDDSNAPVLSSAPTNLTATANGYRSVSLSWNALTGASYYTVERSYNSGSTWTTLNGSVSSASYLDSTITANTEALYRVKGVNASGASPGATVVGSGTPFLPPSSVTTSVAGVDSILISWTPYDSNATYKLERSDNGSVWSAVVTNYTGTSYVDQGLTVDCTWRYRVSSYLSSTGYSAPSNVVSVFLAATIPATPTLTRATLLDANTISLTWSSVPGASSYLLARSTDGVNWATPVVVSGSSYEDASSGINASTTNYYYRVSAQNTAGTSNASAAVQAVPEPIVSFSPTQQASNSLTLSWTNGSSDFPFRLERSLDESTWTTLASNLTSPTYADSGLTPNTTYYYRVCLVANVCSSWTSTSAQTYPAAPNSPTISVSTTVDSSTISWNAVTGATSYSVERSLDSQTWSVVANQITGTSCVDSGLAPRTGYYYRARAVNVGGASSPSAVVLATTATPAPTITSVSAISQTELRIIWSAAIGSEVFRLERSLDGGTTWIEAAANLTSNSYNDTGLTSGTCYTYRVVSVWSGTESYVSQPSSAYTLAPRWIVGVAASDDFASERGSDFGTYLISRAAGTDASTSTEVCFTMSGSADSSDYTLYNSYGQRLYSSERELDGTIVNVYSVTISSGATSTSVELRPTSDSTSERTEIASLILLGSDLYDVDAQRASASVNIVDSEPLVQVSASDEVAGETSTGAPTNNGTFVVSRHGVADLSAPLTVAFTLSGSAEYGVDYASISGVQTSVDPVTNETIVSGSVVIASGEESATISILPLDDSTREELETVVLTISESASYGVGVNGANSTVYIVDNEPVPLVWIEASAAASEGTTNGYFRLKRSFVDGPLKVYFSVNDSSTATQEFDFVFATGTPAGAGRNYIEFGAADETVDIRINSFDDGFYEPTETISISLVAALLPDWAPAPYSLGTNRTSTVNLADKPHYLTQAPTGFAATALDYERIQLDWNATPYAVEYQAEISSDGGTTWSVLRDSISTSFYIASALTVNTSYRFRLKARNSYGDSPYSATIQGSPSPLNPPTSVSVVASSIVSTSISWVPVSELVGHTIQRSDDGTTWTTLATNYRETTYQDPNLAMGKTWSYRVFSESASAQLSAPSATGSVFLPLTKAQAPTALESYYSNASTISVSWNPSVGASSYYVERSLDGNTWTCVAASVTSETFVDSDQANNGNLSHYYYRVSSNNAAGRSLPTLAVQTVPRQVNFIWAPEKTNTSITLNWTTESEGFRYRLERLTNGAGTWELLNNQLTTPAFTDEQLTPKTTYSYRITVLTEFGASSVPYGINVATYPNAPTTPPTPSATATEPDEIYLVWTEVEDAADYRLERSKNGAAWKTVDAKIASLEYTDKGLEPGVVYLYRMTANNPTGSSAYSESCLARTPRRAPSPPDYPSAVSLTTDSVNLRWEAEQNCVWILERSSDAGVHWTVIANALTTNTYIDVDLLSNVDYHYRVSVRNESGTSAPSGETVVRTCSNLAVPTGASATPLSVSSISLTWNASPNASSYAIQRSSDYSDWKDVAANITGANYVDLGLQKDMRYYYRIRSIKADGSVSTFSEVFSATTDTVAPEVPETLELIACLDNKVLLIWESDVNATSWKVERSPNAADWTVVAANCESFFFLDEGLTAQTGYFYRISATNRAGTSAPSNSFYIMTLPVADLYEPNDSPLYVDFLPVGTGANLGILTGSKVLSNLTYLDDDYFRFEINAPGTEGHYVRIDTADAAKNLDLQILDADYEIIETATGADGSALVSLEDYAAGVYFVRPVAPNDEIGLLYELTFAVPYVPLVKTAPIIATFEATSPYETSITWNDEPGVLYWQVERSTDSETWTTLDLALETASFTDSYLTPNTLYYYRVVAVYGTDDHYTSTSVSIQTPIKDDDYLVNNSKEDVDSQLIVRATGGILGALTSTKTLDSLALPVGDEDWFRFDLTSERSDASQITLHYGADGDALALELQDAAGETLRYGTLAENDPTVSVSLATLPAGTYYLRVYGANSASNPEYDLTFEPGAPVLGDVQNLTATTLTGGSVNLQWTSVANAVWYQVEASDAETPTEDDWSVIAQCVYANAYTDSSGVPGKRRSYRVRAYREGVVFGCAASASATPPAPAPSAPPTPSSLICDLRDAESMVIAWPHSLNATSYYVQRSADQGATWQGVGSVTTNSYFDGDFDPDVDYSYRVKAVNALGESNWSEPLVPSATNPSLVVGDLSNLSPVDSYAVTTSSSTASGQIQANIGAGQNSGTLSVLPNSGTATFNETTGAWTYVAPTPTVSGGVTSGNVDFFAVKIYDNEDKYVDETYVVLETPDIPASRETTGALSAQADTYTVPNISTAGYSGGVTLDVLDNDLRPTGAALSVTSATLSNSAAGTVSIQSGNIVFTPTANFTGAVSISYTVRDSSTNLTSSSTASVTLTAPPSAWAPGALGQGANNVAGLGFLPTSGLANFASGSLAFELNDSVAIVNGGTQSSSLSVTTNDYGGVYVYRQTESWTYSYTENGKIYSGSYSTSYVYTLSSIRESVKYTVKTSDSIIGGENGTSTTSNETSDYVYVSQTLHGSTTGSEFYKQTKVFENRQTTIGSDTKFGATMPKITNAFSHSFETHTQHKKWSGTGSNLAYSGSYSSSGQEKFTMNSTSSGEFDVSSSTWNDGVCDTRSGEKTISSSDSATSDIHYIAAGSWTSNGWSAATGSSTQTAHGSSSASLSSAGVVAQLSHQQDRSQSASGTFSESVSTQTSWNETVVSQIVNGDWAVTSGTGSHNYDSATSYLSSWSGTYSSSGISGLCSGYYNSESLADKTAQKSIQGNSWVITGGGGTESGSSESETIYNSGYNPQLPSLRGRENMSGVPNGSKTMNIGANTSLAFEHTLSTEFRRNFASSEYSAVTTWENNDWVIDGEGAGISEKHWISEEAGSDGVFNGPSGETGNNASFYCGSEFSEAFEFGTVYDAATEEWNSVSGSGDETSFSSERIEYSGVGSTTFVSDEVNAFFGDEETQGSGSTRTNAIYSFSETSSNSDSDYLYANDEWSVVPNSFSTSSGKSRDVVKTSWSGSFGGASPEADAWSSSGRIENDSASSWTSTDVWNGSDWIATGTALNYSNSISVSNQSSQKTETGVAPLSGALWNSTSKANVTLQSESTEGAFYYMTLNAQGDWELASSETTTPLELPAAPYNATITTDAAPTLNRRFSASESLSTHNVQASNSVISGVYNNVFFATGTSQGTNTSQTESSYSITETIGLKDGVNAWTATGVSEYSQASNESTQGTWKTRPNDATGNVTTTYAKNTAETIATEQALADEVWRYTNGTLTNSFTEETEIDKVLTISMPSNTANGLAINWTVKTGEVSTDSASYNTAWKLTPGEELNWILDTDSTIPNANRGTLVYSLSGYEDRLGQMTRSESTGTKSYGSDGLTYEILEQSFEQHLRVESDGSEITTEYQFDGTDWQELSETGQIVTKYLSSYTMNNNGTYSQGDVSGTFSNQVFQKTTEQTAFNLTTKTGAKQATVQDDQATSFNESGTLEGGTWLSLAEKDGSITENQQFSVTFDEITSILDDDWILENYSLSFTRSKAVDDHYSKTVAFADYSDYVGTSSNVTVDSFASKYRYDKEENNVFSVNMSLARDASTNEYEFSETPVGLESCVYYYLSDASCAVSGTTTNTGMGFSAPGAITKTWGDKTEETKNYTATLNSEGNWDFSNLRVGSHLETSYATNAFEAAEDRPVGRLEYAYASATLDRSGWTIGVKQNESGDIGFEELDRFYETQYQLDWDYFSVNNTTSGVPGNSTTNESTTAKGVHTAQTTRYEYDGAGVSVSVSPPIQSIGNAYSYVSSRYAYERPYSRVYERSGGTVNGTETSDSFESTRIDANVYYKRSDGRQYYVGEATRLSNLTTSYEGTGSYAPADAINGAKGAPGQTYSYSFSHKESEFSEEGSTSNEQRTVSTFDTLKSSSAQSVVYDRLARTNANYQYSASGNCENASGSVSSGGWSTTSTTNEYERGCEEESASEQSWYYSKRTTPDGDVVEHTSRWIGSGNGSRTTVSSQLSQDNSSSGSSYEYFCAWDNHDDYEFDFDGSWRRHSADGFSITAIVLENHVTGDFVRTAQTTNNGQTNGPQSISQPVDRIIATCTFDTQSFGSHAKSELQGLRFTSISEMDVAYFGHYESDPNYSFTPDHIIVAKSSDFSVNASFSTFEIYQQLAPTVATWTETTRAFSAASLIGRFSDEVVSQIGVKEPKVGVITFNPGVIVNACIDSFNYILDYGGEALKIAGKTCLTVGDFFLGGAISRGITVYHNMRETGNGLFMSVYASIGTGIASFTGVLDLNNALEGEDFDTGRRLSGGERLLVGAMGVFDLATTGLGGLGTVKNVIRSTGGCGTAIGKHFRNCCFTEDVEVLLYFDPTAISVAPAPVDAELISIEPEPVEEELISIDSETAAAETVSVESASAEPATQEPLQIKELKELPTLSADGLVAENIIVEPCDRPSTALYWTATLALGAAGFAAALESKRRRAVFANWRSETSDEPEPEDETLDKLEGEIMTELELTPPLDEFDSDDSLNDELLTALAANRESTDVDNAAPLDNQDAPFLSSIGIASDELASVKAKPRKSDVLNLSKKRRQTKKAPNPRI
ncbi:MAG: Ig-like domain-containing protein, partial [Thermoguttaceae bacterium]|nr:Ig-like domain-containing protein [Thermoguttaceae bacterium]